MTLGGESGTLEGPGQRVFDYIGETPRLNGTLYDPKKLKQLENYLSKRGIILKIGDEFLPPGKAGGFDAVSGTLYLRSNPTQYEV